MYVSHLKYSMCMILALLSVAIPKPVFLFVKIKTNISACNVHAQKNGLAFLSLFFFPES